MATVLKKPEEYSWIRYIHQRIESNKNFLGFISGATGSGKSWSSLSIAELCDREFTIERCVFSPKELMQLINSDKLKSGSAIIFEEVGVNFSSRNWQGIINKMLNFLIQTFRHRNFILICNAPFLDFCDAQTRRLFHAEFRTAGINKNKNTCLLKPYTLQYNGRLGKFYYKHLRVLREGCHGSIPVTTWGVPKPSEKLLADYEAKKRQFTDVLNREIQAEIESVGDKRKRLTLQQQQIFSALQQKKNVGQVALELNMQENTIKRAMSCMKDKGYEFKPVYNDRNEVEYYEI